MDIKDYIQGKRHGKEANQLERKAMNDPFLQDAIDGYDAVPGNHLSTIKELENKLAPKSVNKTFKLRKWIVAVAASICLVLGVGSLFINYESTEKDIAHKTIQKINKNTAPKISELPSTKKLSDEKILAHNSLKAKPELNQEVQLEDNSIISENTLDAVSTEKILENPISAMNMANEETVVTAPIQASNFKSTTGNLSKNISGKVVDEKGEAIIGASIKLQDSYNGTVTDLNGNFTLNVPDIKKNRIIASYIGYEKKEIPISPDSNIIQLQPDNLALNEVVVVGYGTQKRSSVVGSVSATKAIFIKYEKAEFENYIQQNHKQNTCSEQKEFIKVKFTLNELGKPVDLEIVACSCIQLEEEFVQLFKNSPKWTIKLQKIQMTIRF
jgi:hypothetical protein